MKRSFKKGDFWLFGSIVLIALLFLHLRSVFATQGSTVTVMVDNTVVKVFSITDEVDQYIEAVDGKNRLCIKNGKVWIEDADCPEGICQRHVPISRIGDSIICLPHHLTITIGGDRDTPDAVVS